MNIKIKDAFIVKPEKNSVSVDQKNVFIQDGKIFFQPPFRQADREIEAKGKIILPALVNAHHHIYSTLSKGVPCEVPFQNFLGNLKNLWWTLDHSLTKEDMILSTAIAAEDSIKNGVTTICDHHISGYTENALSDMANILEKYGISGTLAFELSDRNGKEFFEKSLQENIRFAEFQKNSDIKGMIGLHASFTLADESLKMIADKTSSYPIHVHIAEGEIDGKLCRQKYNKTLIERFEDFGLIRPNSLLIHCSNLTPKDLEILQKQQIFIVQAIDSNLNNGLNVGNISSFIQKKLNVTVGTDGMHSNILKAMKNSLIFTKYQNQTPDIGYPEIKQLLLNNYKLKQELGFPLGLKAGETADLAIFDYQPMTLFNDEKFWDHFIFGITESRCQYVIKNDRILLDNFRLQNQFYQELFARSQEISQKMFKRFELNRGRY